MNRPTSLRSELLEHVMTQHTHPNLGAAITLAELQNFHRRQHSKNWAKHQNHYHMAPAGTEAKGWDTGQDVVAIGDVFDELTRMRDHLDRVLERHAPRVGPIPGPLDLSRVASA